MKQLISVALLIAVAVVIFNVANMSVVEARGNKYYVNHTIKAYCFTPINQFHFRCAKY